MDEFTPFVIGIASGAALVCALLYWVSKRLEAL